MIARAFQPLSILVILLTLGVILALFWFKEEASPNSAESRKKAPQQNLRPSAMAPITPALAVPADAAPVAPADPAPPATEVPRADGKRELQAYRFVVRGGVVSLDGNQRIVGDFHRRRGPQAWMPGMWCVRLLDANMRVLAEETANAPDEACVVLDPNNLDANGKPQATQFSGAGEDAMLQVRLPPNPEAKWLKVYRLSGMERADWNTEPMGQLLTSISLP
jgi:hypothetical protein